MGQTEGEHMSFSAGALSSGQSCDLLPGWPRTRVRFAHHQVGALATRAQVPQLVLPVISGDVPGSVPTRLLEAVCVPGISVVWSFFL